MLNSGEFGTQAIPENEMAGLPTSTTAARSRENVSAPEFTLRVEKHKDASKPPASSNKRYRGATKEGSGGPLTLDLLLE